MALKKNRNPIFPVALLFIVLNGFFIAGKSMLQRWGFDQNVLIIGNVFLFVITLLSFLLARRGLTNPNPNAFIRSAYSSILLKLFATLIAAAVYLFIYKKDMNKPAFFTLMGLYLVYTFVEVSALTRALKQQKNA